MGNLFFTEKWQPINVERIMEFENHPWKLRLVVENLIRNSKFIQYLKVSPYKLCINYKEIIIY